MACYEVHSNLEGQEENVRNILLTFDSSAVVAPQGGIALWFEVSGEQGIRVESRLCAPDRDELVESIRDEEIQDSRYSEADVHRRMRECVRLACLRLMARFTGRTPSPWGILTGVRPSKVYHHLLSLGFAPSEAEARMVSVYELARVKADLLRRVAVTQRPFLNVRPHQVGIYVGIPFCPSRCAYCSFASYPLTTHGHHVEPFMNALSREIDGVAGLVGRLGLEVTTLYVGGGTPTALPAAGFEGLMELLAGRFGGPALDEFTVEAGRPDTITAAHVEAMARHGVTRVSVNPQTMNQRTLDAVGRIHTTAQVGEAVALVRDSGIPIVNMDLIAGLPGERASDVGATLHALEPFKPENLTVHTLAIKRASNWRARVSSLQFPTDAEVEVMVERVREWAENRGMRPYYLYRQRFILGNLENLGYAQPGAESPYNIQMIEERQTVIGLGGGGVSRLVNPLTGEVTRLSNPKCPATYALQVEELLGRKVRSIETLLH